MFMRLINISQMMPYILCGEFDLFDFAFWLV